MYRKSLLFGRLTKSFAAKPQDWSGIDTAKQASPQIERQAAVM
jgi:hypothetical protein